MPFDPTSVLSAAGRSQSIRSAIQLASQRTGVDFGYLLGQAQVESGMNATARAGTSSATGLYQFVEQSWLQVVKQHGAEHGLSWASDAITQGSNGRMTVSDPVLRRQILALRNDPQSASLMAAEYASDNADGLQSTIGRTANGTDLYMAHFLGLGGARQFLSALQSNPQASGAALFPAAARANRNVFFNSSGQARSLSDIYQRFTDRLGQGAQAGGNAVPAIGNSAARLSYATLLADGSEVIPGSGDTTTAAAAEWAASTLDRMNGAGGSARLQTASLYRPTPSSARLAYMMLARMGTNVA